MRGKSTLKYYLPDNGQDIDDCFEVEVDTTWINDSEWMAQEAADDYHSNHDGWEASWPLEIVVVLSNGEHVTCSVDREAVPQFTARRLSGRCQSIKEVAQ